jgi:hypothetical protein
MQGGFAHVGYSIIPETECDDEKTPALGAGEAPFLPQDKEIKKKLGGLSPLEQ